MNKRHKEIRKKEHGTLRELGFLNEEYVKTFANIRKFTLQELKDMDLKVPLYHRDYRATNSLQKYYLDNIEDICESSMICLRKMDDGTVEIVDGIQRLFTYFKHQVGSYKIRARIVENMSDDHARGWYLFENATKFPKSKEQKESAKIRFGIDYD